MKKKRELPLIIGVLSAVTLGTIGFSSWIIDGENTGATENGITIEVGEVVNNDVSIKDAKISSTQKAIVFDNNKEGGIGLIGKGTAKEQLHLDFSFVLTGSEDLATASTQNGKAVYTPTSLYKGLTISLTGKSSDGTNSKYINLITQKYIIAPFQTGVGTTINKPEKFDTEVKYYVVGDRDVQYSITYSPVDPDVDLKNFNVSITANYMWGEKFAFTNPCDIDFDKNATLNREQVATDIATLHNNLLNCTYELVVTPIA